MLNWLTAYNYVGDATFFTEGASNAKSDGRGTILGLICGTMTAFGGGAFIRDLLILNTVPSILSNPVELLFVCGGGLVFLLVATYFNLFHNIPEKHPRMNRFLGYGLAGLDALGVLGFAVIGYNRGIHVHGCWLVAICTGTATAVGGGFIALVIKSFSVKGLTNKAKHFAKKTKANIPYYCFGVVMTTAYCLLSMVGEDQEKAVILLTPLAIIIGLAIYRKASKNHKRR